MVVVSLERGVEFVRECSDSMGGFVGAAAVEHLGPLTPGGGQTSGARHVTSRFGGWRLTPTSLASTYPKPERRVPGLRPPHTPHPRVQPLRTRAENKCGRGPQRTNARN